MKHANSTVERISSFIGVVVLVLAIIVLAGCSTTSETVKQVNPPWPSPVRFEPIHFDVDPEQPTVLKMSLDSAKNLDIIIKDMLRYIDQSNSIICFYRKESPDICHKD